MKGSPGIYSDDVMVNNTAVEQDNLTWDGPINNDSPALDEPMCSYSELSSIGTVLLSMSQTLEGPKPASGPSLGITQEGSQRELCRSGVNMFEASWSGSGLETNWLDEDLWDGCRPESNQRDDSGLTTDKYPTKFSNKDENHLDSLKANIPSTALNGGGNLSCAWGYSSLSVDQDTHSTAINDGSLSISGWTDFSRPETRNTSKKWDPTVLGKMSYAELITKAIEGSPDGRLTLAQIYEWMIASVPYFKERADGISSAGWKNSIRHNLSLHTRFRRVVNETAGRSSWWVIDYSVPAPTTGTTGPQRPSGGRSRANTIDPKLLSNSRRGRAKRKIEESGNASSSSPTTSQTTTPCNALSKPQQTSLLQSPLLSWDYTFMDESELEPKRRISACQLPPQFVPTTTPAQFASFAANFGTNDSRVAPQEGDGTVGNAESKFSFGEKTYQTIGDKNNNVLEYSSLEARAGNAVTNISSCTGNGSLDVSVNSIHSSDSSAKDSLSIATQSVATTNGFRIVGSANPEKTGTRDLSADYNLSEEAVTEALATLLVDGMVADGTLDTVTSNLMDILESSDFVVPPCPTYEEYSSNVLNDNQTGSKNDQIKFRNCNEAETKIEQTNSNSSSSVVEKFFVNGDRSSGGTCMLRREKSSEEMPPIGMNLRMWKNTTGQENSNVASIENQGLTYSHPDYSCQFSQHNTKLVANEILDGSEILIDSSEITAIASNLTADEAFKKPGIISVSSPEVTISNSSSPNSRKGSPQRNRSILSALLHNSTDTCNTFKIPKADILKAISNLATAQEDGFRKPYDKKTSGHFEIDQEERQRRSSFPSFGSHPFFLPVTHAQSLPSISQLENLCRNSLFHNILDDLDLQTFEESPEPNIGSRGSATQSTSWTNNKHTNNNNNENLQSDGADADEMEIQYDASAELQEYNFEESNNAMQAESSIRLGSLRGRLSPSIMGPSDTVKNFNSANKSQLPSSSNSEGCDDALLLEQTPQHDREQPGVCSMGVGNRQPYWHMLTDPCEVEEGGQQQRLQVALQQTALQQRQRRQQRQQQNQQLKDILYQQGHFQQAELHHVTQNQMLNGIQQQLQRNKDHLQQQQQQQQWMENHLQQQPQQDRGAILQQKMLQGAVLNSNVYNTNTAIDSNNNDGLRFVRSSSDVRDGSVASMINCDVTDDVNTLSFPDWLDLNVPNLNDNNETSNDICNLTLNSFIDSIVTPLKLIT